MGKRPLVETLNCPVSEEIHSSNCLDKDAQKIASMKLKRIYPTLWSRRVVYGDEDEHQMGDGNPIEADLQIKQGCDLLQPSI